VLPPYAAAGLSLAAVALAFAVNRLWFGFLPDDRPQKGRKQHARPVPLGGIALLPVLLPWLLASGLPWLAAGVAAVTLLGYADDWSKEHGRELDWKKKLVLLALSSALAANQAVDPFAAPERWLLAWCLVFVLTNATNFLDNTDGVATALSAASLLVATGGDGAFAAVGFAALGFLPWNWPRPFLFVGDSGAFALGLCCGALCATRLPAFDRALLPFAVQLADFAQVVTVRLWLGFRPWIGDRRHLPHIAQNLGLPRPLVAPLFAGAAVLLAGLAA